MFSCQVVVHYGQVKLLSHPYNYSVNDETEVEMTDVRFKVIERTSVEQVVEVAAMLIGRGYNPATEVTKMPNTGHFTQVMQWEPNFRTPKLHA